MQLFDWIFLGFGISLTLICAKRGFLLTLLKFSKMILSVLAASLLGSKIGAFFGEKFFNPIIRKSIYEKVSSVYENTTGELGSKVGADVLPKYLQTDAMRVKLDALEGNGEELVNSVTDTVSGAISSVVSGIVGFVLTFVLAFLLLSVVYIVIKNMRDSYQFFGTADSVCGGILGFVFSFAVLLFAGSLLKFFFGNQPLYTDSTVVKFFGDSNLLGSLKFLDPGEMLKSMMESSL